MIENNSDSAKLELKSLRLDLNRKAADETGDEFQGKPEPNN